MVARAFEWNATSASTSFPSSAERVVPPHWWELSVDSGTMIVAVDACVIIVAAMLIAYRMQASSSGVTLGKATNVRTTFRDVAGIDEVKGELEEVVSILRHPARFTALGAKVPRGVLLEGPPGCGKTLCARAVAGEAGVPFFNVCGSDFMEVFVGVGASRVRELFKKAKKAAPCIVFIDEIDAIARKRGSGASGGGSDERDQTINALLSEMDGFAGNTGVVVMAATNRRDVLDPAVVRAGRFDRTITVPMPDVRGRAAIMRVHAHEKPLDADVDVTDVARRTPGFSGADLENLANEAAMMAAREGAHTVAARHFELAMDRVVLGPERCGAVLTAETKMVLAVHEAGHAIVGATFDDYDVVKKVTIIPRGRSGGATHFEPHHDEGLHTRDYLEKKIMTAFGGRVAEELLYGRGQVTTGASGDLEVVGTIARSMVAAYGFNSALGVVSWCEAKASEADVDKEVRILVLDLYGRTRHLLDEKRDVIRRVADALYEKETLSQDELEALL